MLAAQMRRCRAYPWPCAPSAAGPRGACPLPPWGPRGDGGLAAPARARPDHPGRSGGAGPAPALGRAARGGRPALRLRHRRCSPCSRRGSTPRPSRAAGWLVRGPRCSRLRSAARRHRPGSDVRRFWRSGHEPDGAGTRHRRPDRARHRRAEPLRSRSRRSSALLRIAFFLAIAFVLYLFWRERRFGHRPRGRAARRPPSTGGGSGVIVASNIGAYFWTGPHDGGGQNSTCWHS